MYGLKQQGPRGGGGSCDNLSYFAHKVLQLKTLVQESIRGNTQTKTRLRFVYYSLFYWFYFTFFNSDFEIMPLNGAHSSVVRN